MCGINGIVWREDAAGTGALECALDAMRDCLAHRGPDEAGAWRGANVALGHRRLSIVDLAAGQQPMTNEDGRLHIVFNGEIYNHADYRAELEARGHRYRSHCDTETILHLYEEHGAECVHRLRGMFAFAIWDERKQELLIARDRLGVKPLYYVHNPDGALYFASEIKALLRAGAVRAELNYHALPDYLANHATSGDETLFCGVKRLMPGHTLRWQNGRIEIKRYWDLRFASNAEANAGALARRSDESLIEEWTERFREAVRVRLMADVPLGMFLSGGIDSSAIAGVMAGMIVEPVKTFSVAFKERDANELAYARIVAEAFKTEHHEIVVTPREFFKELPRLVWHEDEPLAHPSSVALYFVSRLASEHVKVVLTGEGSDEMMAGYGRYWKTMANLAFAARYNNLTPAALRRLVRAGIERLPRGSRYSQKLARTFLALDGDIESLYFDNFAVFNRRWQRELLTPEARERIGDGEPYAGVRRALAETDADTPLNRLLYADTKTYLHELLMKQDQMSMAASIESRVPFLDHKLVEFTAALPERMKLRGANGTKYILRRAMERALPAEILHRPKMGFPTPVGRWFRGEFKSVVDEYALGERTLARGMFEPDALRRVAAEHAAGVADHTERLWSLVNFEMWQRQFIDGETLHTAAPEVAATCAAEKRLYA